MANASLGPEMVTPPSQPTFMRSDQLVLLHPWQLLPSPLNSRKRFDGLEELAESIRSVGILQNLVVRIADLSLVTNDNRLDARAHEVGPRPFYEVVAGGRRLRAARIAGIDSVPCIIRTLSDRDVREIVLTENSQRDGVHPLEEAETMRASLAAGDYGPADAKASKQALADRLGLSLSYVYQRLLLLDLTEEAQKEFLDGSITVSHAIPLARLPVAAQEKMLKDLLWDQVYHCGAWRDTRRTELHWGARGFEQRIAELYNRKLSSARFNIKDANLLKVAGPCTECPKRSGYNSDLFGESPISAHDRCLDTDCWDKKLARHNKVIVDRALAEAPDAVRISVEWGGAVRGVISRGSYQLAKDDEPGVIAIVADGSDVGKVVRVAITSSAAMDPGAIAEAKRIREAKEAHRKAWAKAESKVRMALFDDMLDRFGDRPSLLLLRIVAEALAANLSEEPRKLIYGRFGWNKKEMLEALIPNLDEAECIRLIVALSLRSEVSVTEWDFEQSARKSPPRMTALATSTGLDVDALRAKIYAEAGFDPQADPAIPSDPTQADDDVDPDFLEDDDDLD